MKRSNTRFISGTITVLLCSLTAASLLSACRASDEDKPVSIIPTATTENTFPDALLDSKDLAFTARCENQGPYNWGCDYWTNASYFVYYDGTIEIKTSYTLSGESDVSAEISYTDIKRIRDLADTFKEKKDSYDMDYSDTYDGVTWSFYSYDTDGSRNFVYSGYTYGLTELVGIQNTLARYDKNESLIDRAYDVFEGTYICADDDQQYVSLYKKDGQIFFEVRSSGMKEPAVYEIREIVFAEEYVSFNYVEDDMWHGLSYSYSVGKTQIQDAETSAIYNKQMNET